MTYAVLHLIRAMAGLLCMALRQAQCERVGLSQTCT